MTDFLSDSFLVAFSPHASFGCNLGFFPTGGLVFLALLCVTFILRSKIGGK